MFDSEDHNLAALQDFLAAARQGKLAGGKASSGEAAAIKLARQVSRISAAMQSMDRGLQEGFCFALVAAAFPDTRGTVLQLLPN